MSRLEISVNQYEPKDFEIYTHNDRPEMLDYVPQDAAMILDVGCALGNFGYLLKTERSVEVWGVEISEYAASIAAQKLDKVICGAFDEKINLPHQQFDCIVFNDVLEHLIDPSSALTLAKSLLKPGGTVVASIPNVRYFDNIWKLLVHQDWHYTEQGILDRTHLRFFTHKSITHTFESVGYSVERLQGIGAIEIAHPHQAKRFNVLNRFLFNKIQDMRYLQFAIVASFKDYPEVIKS